MKKGSAYRFAEPYRLVNGDEEAKKRTGDEAVDGEGTYLLPTGRHQSQAETASPEPPEEPGTSVTVSEEKHNSGCMTATTLIPLSEIPEEPPSPKKKPEKKYIGDDVITSFLQDPLTTLLYYSHPEGRIVDG